MAMDPQDQRDLATVMDIVLGDVPEDEAPVPPGPFSHGVRLGPLELPVEVVRRPLLEACAHLVPGLLEGGANGGRVAGRILDLLVVDRDQALELLVALAHPGLEPPGTRGGDVTGEDADRPEALARGPRQLFVDERRNCLDEQPVVRLPAGVEIDRPGHLRLRWYHRPANRSGCSPPQARTTSQSLPKRSSTSSLVKWTLTTGPGLL